MSASHHAIHIPEADRIPFLQKIMFSLGTNTEYVATGLMTGVLWMPYFNIGMGMSPIALDVVLIILRTWEAFVDACAFVVIGRQLQLKAVVGEHRPRTQCTHSRSEPT